MFGNQSAYSVYKGVSRAAVSKWKRLGLVAFDASGAVDFKASDRLVADHGFCQPKLTNPSGTEPTLFELDGEMMLLLSRFDAETVKENYNARLKKLEYDRKAALVVEVDDAARMIYDECQIVRIALRGIAERVTPCIVACNSADEVMAAQGCSHAQRALPVQGCKL